MTTRPPHVPQAALALLGMIVSLGACLSPSGAPTQAPAEPAAESPAASSVEAAQAPAQAAQDPAQGQAAPAAIQPGGIISIAPSATELLFAIGAGERVTARSYQCDFPPEVRALPSIGSGLEPDVERIVSGRPALVVGSAMQANLVALPSLRAAGIEVLLVPDGSVEQAYEALVLLGDRLDLREQAAGLQRQIAWTLAAIEEENRGAQALGTAFVVGDDPIYLAGTETYLSTLLEIAGARNVATGSWVRADDEAFVALAPELLIVSIDGDAGSLPGSFSRFDRAVPALREGRICAVEPSLVARPGPRLGEAARAIARCVQEARSAE